MEFKFDPQERRLRIRTLVPAGQDPRTFAPDEHFQFGIEEEYFLSDAQTLQAPSETPDALFRSAETCTSGHVGREFLQAQIEVATEPHRDSRTARRELQNLREHVPRRRRRSMGSLSWPAALIRWPRGATPCKAPRIDTRR